VLAKNSSTNYDTGWVPPSAGHTIQDEGIALTQRAGLNFVGAGVTATDDSANSRTLVTIPGQPAIPRGRGTLTGSAGASASTTPTLGGTTVGNGMTVSGNGLKVPIAGYYRMVAQATINPPTGVGYIQMQFQVNGTPTGAIGTGTADIRSGASYVTATANEQLLLNANDVVATYLTNGSSQSVTINGGVFTLEYIGQ
jgi:hypothetical protein